MSEWLNKPWVQELWKSTYPYLPGLAAALGILIGGWILAWVIHKVVFAALKRTTVDDKIAALMGMRLEEGEHRIERLISRTVYYVLLAFVFVAFFDRLKIDAVTRPVLTALDGLTAAVPNLLKAVVIGFIGFVLATLVRKLILVVLDKTGLVTKLEKLAGDSGSPDTTPQEGKATKKKKKKRELADAPLATTIADVAYWFIMIVAAIPVLEALKIGALASPLSNALATVTVFLPKIVAAMALLIVGYVLARIARSVIATVFDKVGVDRAVGKLGFSKIMAGQTVGNVLGTIAMAFILLNFAISAVGRLDIKEISVPLGLMLEQIYGFLPKLLVGVVLMAIAIVIARIASNVVARLLAAMGFNTLMMHIGVFKDVSATAKQQERESKALIEARRKGEAEDDEGDDPDDLLAETGSDGIQTPADVAGVAVAAVIVLLFLRQALSSMGLAGLAAMLGTLIGYLPNVAVAAVVLGAGMWAGSWAHRRADELTKTVNDRLMKALGSVAHVSIVAFAAMIAAQQLGVGRQLIGIAFALVLGCVCLAVALAFGLGGREVAGKILQKEYDRRQGPGAGGGRAS